MKGTVTTRLKGKKYIFSFIIHCSMNQTQHRIEPEFYLQKSLAKQLPEGTHHEVEILEHGYHDHPYWNKVHQHPSAKDQKNYICWTGPIPSCDIAAFMTRMWCVGTTYTLETGEDFAKLYEQHKIDPNKFYEMEELLRTKYGIVISASRFDFLN